MIRTVGAEPRRLLCHGKGKGRTTQTVEMRNLRQESSGISTRVSPTVLVSGSRVSDEHGVTTVVPLRSTDGLSFRHHAMGIATMFDEAENKTRPDPQPQTSFLLGLFIFISTTEISTARP